MSKLEHTAGRPVISDLNTRQNELTEQILSCKTRENWNKLRSDIVDLKLINSQVNPKLSTLLSIVETKQAYNLTEYPLLTRRLIELVDCLATCAKDRLVAFSAEVYGRGIQDAFDGGSGEW